MSEPRVELASWVTIRAFSFPWEAELARARLEAEGIAAAIGDEHLIRMDWMISSALGGVKLRVAPEDAARAVAALDDSQPLSELHLVTDEDSSAPRCPQCRSDELVRLGWSRRLFFVGALALGFPVPLFDRRFRCRRCGTVVSSAGRRPSGDDTATEAPLATVAAFDRPFEAELARQRLAGERIDACVIEERLPAINLFSGAALPSCRLQVRAEDRERALEVLSAVGAIG